MSPEDAAKVADLLKSPLRSSSLEDLAAKLVTFVLATSIIEETVGAEPLDSEDLISIIRGALRPVALYAAAGKVGTGTDIAARLTPQIAAMFEDAVRNRQAWEATHSRQPFPDRDWRMAFLWPKTR